MLVMVAQEQLTSIIQVNIKLIRWTYSLVLCQLLHLLWQLGCVWWSRWNNVGNGSSGAAYFYHTGKY